MGCSSFIKSADVKDKGEGALPVLAFVFETEGLDTYHKYFVAYLWS
jgi:hypothetical protein